MKTSLNFKDSHPLSLTATDINIKIQQEPEEEKNCLGYIFVAFYD